MSPDAVVLTPELRASIEREAIAANNAALAERVRGLADVRVWNEWTDAFDDHDELVDRAAVLDLLVPTVTTDPSGDTE